MELCLYGFLQNVFGILNFEFIFLKKIEIEQYSLLGYEQEPVGHNVVPRV